MVFMASCGSLGLSGLLLLAACHLEDHTPAGTRRDEAQILSVINEYYRAFSARDWATCRKFFAPSAVISYIGVRSADSSSHSVLIPADSMFLAWARLMQEGQFPPPRAQILRTDLRQSDDHAAAWVTVRQSVARGAGGTVVWQDDIEHWVLQRTSDGWRIVLLFLPRASR